MNQVLLIRKLKLQLTDENPYVREVAKKALKIIEMKNREEKK